MCIFEPVCYYFKYNFPVIMMPVVLFLLFNIGLSIQNVLYFHMNFTIIFSTSEKNVISILVGLQLNM